MSGPSLSLDEAVGFAKQYLCGPILTDDLEASSSVEDFARITRQLKLSAENPDLDALDFYALSVTAAGLLRMNKRLPPWLATFAADVLEGKRKRPSKKGPDKYSNWERDYKFWRTCQEVANKFSLQVYSNNELSTKITAAEVVSIAAGCSKDVVVTAYKKQNRVGVE